MSKKKRINRIDIPYGRAYVLGDNLNEYKFLPSITSILSLKSNEKLKELEKEIGKEELAKISDRAALRGTAMHSFLENYLICVKHKGNPETCLLYTQRKSTDVLLESMEKDRVDVGRSLFYNVYYSGLLDNIKTVLFTEQFLYSETNLFAGTTDFAFVDTDNKIVMVDFKSSSSLRDKDTVNKYKCQAAAYIIAFEEIYNKKVDRGEIWIANPDGMQHEVIRDVELEEKKEEFLDLCRTYHSMWDCTPFIEHLSKTSTNDI